MPVPPRLLAEQGYRQGSDSAFPSQGPALTHCAFYPLHISACKAAARPKPILSLASHFSLSVCQKAMLDGPPVLGPQPAAPSSPAAEGARAACQQCLSTGHKGVWSWLQPFSQAWGLMLVSFVKGYMGAIRDFKICIGLPSTSHVVIPNSWLYSSLRIGWVGLQILTRGEWYGDIMDHTFPEPQQTPCQRRRAWAHPCQCAHHLHSTGPCLSPGSGELQRRRDTALLGNAKGAGT